MGGGLELDLNSAEKESSLNWPVSNLRFYSNVNIILTHFWSFIYVNAIILKMIYMIALMAWSLIY